MRPASSRRLAAWLVGGAVAAALAAQPPRPELAAPTVDDLVLERDDGGRAHLAPTLFRRPSLGLEAVDLTPELRRHLHAPSDRGVLVAEVAGGGPAAAADVRVGDILLALGGEPIGSAWELERELRARPAGERLALELSRGGAALVAEVELAAVELPTFDLGPEVWRLREAGAPHWLLLRPPGSRDELVVDTEEIDALAERLADRLGTPAWRGRLERRDLTGRIAELEERLAELEAELERLRRED